MQFLFALDFFRNVYYNYNDVSGGASSSPKKSEWDSAENLIDGGDGVTIPPS